MRQLTIDQKTLSNLAHAGSIKEAKVIGSSGNWSVAVQVGDGRELSLISQRKEARIFRNVDSLIAFLSGMGISNIHITIAEAMVKAISDKTAKRPDRSETMKKIHEAAAYDKWFRDQIKAAQNSSRPSLTLEESNASLASRKAAKIANVKGIK